MASTPLRVHLSDRDRLGLSRELLIRTLAPNIGYGVESTRCGTRLAAGFLGPVNRCADH
ncbi:hypothetical protein G3T14_02635 [Methylobacterium sp. BTF04]|uniref:hypothetical protein n=1 Tax=Methylobacterium sp. BTF04 TaxID=2708300 RepID=UPI0013D122B8|nr:hypothetical protein [Methylobacterium sp. BTF04]NEU11029.1 hypothetical protein [Methylobacterium sp. BTF04]